MRKSIFAKYIVTFSLIIIVSFTILTVIFGNVLNKYSTDQTDTRLCDSVDSLAARVDAYGAEHSTPVLDCANIISEVNGCSFIICQSDGKVIFSKAEDSVNTIVLSTFETKTVNGREYLFFSGKLKEDDKLKSRVFAVKTDSGLYVLGYINVPDEDITVSILKTSVFTAVIWVLVASVIAVNFITERIMRPIRQIKKATTEYGKGKFDTRVRVEGKDEIAMLGKAFNDMADSLEKTEKMRNAFLANVSHDLRTPMTTISGFIDGINSGAIPPEKHEYYLNIISAEIHRLSRLVSLILDVSRLESGERKFVFFDFDVAEEARLILISFEKKIEEKQLNVEFESDDCVMVHADKDAIYQVLYNLCHNAIKFSRDNGTLSIRIAQKDDKVTVSVFDEGQSISADEMPYIFDRFYKTDKSRGLDKNGVGLGLYICKAIMDAHGQSISVKSTEGENCEFSFTLAKSGMAGRKQFTEEANNG